MLNIVLFGPPGAGKGTQAEKLIEKYQLVHLSTGDIFRANLKAETELGLLVRSYMDAGQLVPDDVTIKMLEAEVKKHPIAKGFVFDGFPRTQAQAAALDSFLKGKSTSITMMLALEVNEVELKKRLILRGQDSGRPDDKNPEVIQNRINVYNAETAPVKDFYSAQGKYYGVNGVGDIEDVFNKLCFVIDFNREPKEESSVVSQKIILHNAIPKEEKTKPALSIPVVAKTETVKEPVKINRSEEKKEAKPVKKNIAEKKAVKKTVKKVVKKVVPKKVAKKASPKKAAKKVVKKKIVKKAAKKKVVAKKVAKKKAAKKIIKKVVKKKVALKKVIKKKVAAKKAAPKKVLKKKVVKKVKSSAKKKK